MSDEVEALRARVAELEQTLFQIRGALDGTDPKVQVLLDNGRGWGGLGPAFACVDTTSRAAFPNVFNGTHWDDLTQPEKDVRFSLSASHNLVQRLSDIMRGLY